MRDLGQFFKKCLADICTKAKSEDPEESDDNKFLSEAIELLCIPLLNRQDLPGSNLNQVCIKSSVVALLKLTTNCTMTCVANRQIKATIPQR